MSQRSTALAHTQAEFAYILLFIALGALALLFLQYRAAREERAFLLDQIARMEEKKNAAYPCWVRPDGVIPEIAGTLVIHSADSAELKRTNGGFVKIVRPEDADAAATEEWNRRDAAFSAVRRTFQQDNQYAAGNRCYIRVKVENRTNDYNLFLETAQVLKSLGIVVVNE
ncbi:MAG: hypothetical protein RQ801_07480 [Spirochaetaceae bacterium]|nr:hypothetical protein [Spirochaetaceae bacterium]MDT8298123.1 hypothetical protein [Spirochaetaceae bacterium]